MGVLDALDLPVLGQQGRHAKPKGAEPSRLQSRVEYKKASEGEERRWRREVWARDGGCCRWCRRTVRKTFELVPDRGECHHVSGREVRAITWDRRNGLLVYCACHERLTGKVAEKFVLASSHTFTVDGMSYINADKPLRFKRVV